MWTFRRQIGSAASSETDGQQLLSYGQFFQHWHSSSLSGLFLPVLLLLLAGSVAQAQQLVPADTLIDVPREPESAFVDALRSRGLLRLLELYCRERLADPELTAAARAHYTITLANTLADRARKQQDQAARNQLWQQATELLQQYIAANRDSPRRPAAQCQLGIHQLTHGEWAWRQAEVATGRRRAELSAEARVQLEAAAQSFQAVVRQVAELRRGRSVSSSVQSAGKQQEPAAVAPERLEQIEQAARYALARTWLTLAYASTDRTERLKFAEQARSEFEPLCTRYVSAKPVLDSFLGLAESYRLLRQWQSALKLLARLEQPATPAQYRDQAKLLRAKLLLDRQMFEQCRNFLADLRPLLGESNAELELLYLEATVRWAILLARLNERERASKLLTESAERVERIADGHGPYWSARAELLLAAAEPIASMLEQPRALIRMANGLYRLGQINAAVGCLDRAERLAEQVGQADQAVDAAYRAASMRLEQGQLTDAAKRFDSIATRHPGHRRAPQAHFSAACCLGQLWKRQAESRELPEAYAAALEEHQRRFHGSPTVGEARWLLGRLRAAQRRWAEAVQWFELVPVDHPRYSAARQQAAKVLGHWFDELDVKGQPARHIVVRAARFLEESLPAASAKELKAWQVPVAVQLARLYLRPELAQYGKAESLAGQLMQLTAASPGQRAEAAAIALLAMSEQSQFDQAAALLPALSGSAPKNLLQLLNQLRRQADASAGARRRGLGQLLMKVGQLLSARAEQLSEQQQLELELALAIGYAYAGRAADADTAFRRLRDRLPANRTILNVQVNVAMQLGQYERARMLLRELLQLLPEGANDWLEAKYQLARACYLAGQRDQCRKIITITKLLYPELGNPELKRKFELLEARCK